SALDLPAGHTVDDEVEVGAEQCSRQTRRAAVEEAAPGSLVSQQIDVYKGRSLNWVKVENGPNRASFVLSLPDGWLRLQPCAGGASDPADPSATWDVVHQRRRAAPDLIARGLTIGYAHGVAEDLLRHNGVAIVLFDPRAAWRARPATTKQRDTLTKLGVSVP